MVYLTFNRTKTICLALHRDLHVKTSDHMLLSLSFSCSAGGVRTVHGGLWDCVQRCADLEVKDRHFPHVGWVLQRTCFVIPIGIPRKTTLSKYLFPLSPSRHLLFVEHITFLSRKNKYWMLLFYFSLCCNLEMHLVNAARFFLFNKEYH